MRALCLGGPLDGREAEYEGTYFQVGKSPYVLASIYQDSQGSIIYVWTYGPRTLDWVIQRLMRNYHAAKITNSTEKPEVYYPATLH